MAKKKKKETFASYMGYILQNSMLTGIPQIVSATSLPKKIVRTVVFILCVVGFIYQSLTFMDIYWEYKTIVDVKVINPSEEIMPAITVCTYNGLMLSKLCKDPGRAKHKFKCRKLESTEEDDVCKRLPRYCPDGVLEDFEELPLEDISRIASIPWEERRKWMPTFYEFVECRGDGTEENDTNVDCKERNVTYIEMGCPNENSYPEYCATYNTLIGRPDAVPLKVQSDSKALYWLNHMIEEAPSTLKMTLVYAAFHSPYQILNPFDNGFKMDAGLFYYFHLKKIVKELLPYPYETNCLDYMAQWKARGGMGPLTLKDCMLECRKNLSLERYGCVLEVLQMPGNELRCPSNFTDNTLIEASKACSNEKCRASCHEDVYVVSTEVLKQTRQLGGGSKDLNNSGFYMQMDGMETTIYSYSPKYHDIETFSYLGGYVGMWLGISLVAVFDFLETMVLMVRYPLRKYGVIRAKRTRLKRLKQIRRNV